MTLSVDWGGAEAGGERVQTAEDPDALSPFLHPLSIPWDTSLPLTLENGDLPDVGEGLG